MRADFCIAFDYLLSDSVLVVVFSEFGLFCDLVRVYDKNCSKNKLTSNKPPVAFLRRDADLEPLCVTDRQKVRVPAQQNRQRHADVERKVDRDEVQVGVFVIETWNGVEDDHQDSRADDYYPEQLAAHADACDHDEDLQQGVAGRDGGT